jgi:4-hydroxy-3-polyprenylbenzoate decarboxylase
MGTLGRIANGVSNDLITRAADVFLKERRPLILVVREAPYNLIHIRNMEQLTLAGGIVFPASPSFYHHPVSIEQLYEPMIERVLKMLGFQLKTREWGIT